MLTAIFACGGIPPSGGRDSLYKRQSAVVRRFKTLALRRSWSRCYDEPHDIPGRSVSLLVLRHESLAEDDFPGHSQHEIGLGHVELSGNIVRAQAIANSGVGHGKWRIDTLLRRDPPNDLATHAHTVGGYQSRCAG